jgi:2-oxoglutarate dehydrogenase E1 component
MERFLAMGAEDNIQVVYPTTPAQYFHVVRRQYLRQWRKPLVMMSPKSLLRHPDVTSSIDECATGSFQRVIPDQLKRPASHVKRVLLCTGKIYYELNKRRADLKREDIAIVRLEQLYPLRRELLEQALAQYESGIQVVWVQEEPENMGAWRYLRVSFGERLFDRFPFSGISREASASPATGSAIVHKKEQEKILEDAFQSDIVTPAILPAEKHGITA